MARSDIGLPNPWAKGSLWSMTDYAQVVTFIGAGGKTTCLRSMTQEIDAAGHRVIATTTTKVFPEESMKGWKNSTPPPFEHKGAYFWYVNVIGESGKWMGPSLSAVDNAITLPDFLSDHDKRYWVIEGDGARGLKLKCWEPHEPQIPHRSDCAVLVLEGSLWGKVLQAEQVHRSEGCRDLIGHIWNAEKAWRYFLRSPVFNFQYREMSWVILLNCHGANTENEDLMEPRVLLQDLRDRWEEVEAEIKDQDYRPKHLRFAAGDAKEGRLQWFDLW